MPTFNGNQLGLATTIYPGDTIPLFAASDTLAAGSNSIVIAPGDAGGVNRNVVTFQLNFASAPTSVLKIFGSNTYPTTAGPQNGVLLYTSTNLQADNYTDNLGFAFYWAELVSQSAGGALTLTAHVR
jgi:hypothetical protein